jgi:transcriptional regulator with XRE-family HTH domain
MTNVVPIPTWKPKTFTSPEALLDEVRRQRGQVRLTNKQLASEVGVSASTVSNFQSGKTRWPRPTTLFPLLRALNLEIQLVPRK